MMERLAKLVIANLQLYSYHGATTEEQQLGGRYEIDAELYFEASAAIAHDDLDRTVNYADVMTCISDVASAKRRRLIETLACEIAHAILERFSQVETVCIRVRKRTVPAGRVVDYVEAEWRAHRQS
jgi:dihydroneopterin aldolase